MKAGVHCWPPRVRPVMVLIDLRFTVRRAKGEGPRAELFDRVSCCLGVLMPRSDLMGVRAAFGIAAQAVDSASLRRAVASAHAWQAS
jgi:hypothetical protein